MTVANAVLQGIFLGAFYAVLACGLSIMFGVMRIINLAHGDVAVLGAYIVFVIVQNTGLSPFIAFAVALPVMILLGYILQLTVLERSLRAGILTPLLATFGLSIVIQNLLLITFSPDVRWAATRARSPPRAGRSRVACRSPRSVFSSWRWRWRCSGPCSCSCPERARGG